MRDRRTLTAVPHVPSEIVAKIMFFALYTGNETSDYMQDDDTTGNWLDVRARQRMFCRTFLLVSKDCYRTSMKLLWRCILLTSRDDVQAIREITAKGPVIGERFELGKFCRQVEVRIRGRFPHDALNDILGRCPDLKVFIYRTWGHAPDHPSHDRAGDQLRALTLLNPRLRRVQWESTVCCPSLRALKALLPSFGRLHTLHLDTPRPITVDDDDDTVVVHPIPQLSVLSMGSVHRVYHHYAVGALFRLGDVLNCFPTADLLPNLRAVHFQRPPSDVRRFLSTFGTQLHELSFTTSDIWATAALGQATHIVDLCPNLRRLACIVAPGPPFVLFPRVVPSSSITEVDLIFVHPAGLRGPTWDEFVRKGLEAVDRANMPNLRTIYLVAREQPSTFKQMRWFRSWGRSMRAKNVELRGPVFIT